MPLQSEFGQEVGPIEMNITKLVQNDLDCFDHKCGRLNALTCERMTWLR